MTDEHRDGPLPELTPEQDAEVRRLLVEARHDEPVPADVAQRLDTVLAGLGRDEPGAPGLAPVVDLAARRRRRNAAAVLAGAAAVIVAGFAIGQAIDVGGGSSDDAASTATSADRSEKDAGGGSGPREQTPQLGSPSAAPSAPDATAGVLTLSSTNLAQDLTVQLARLGGGTGSARPEGEFARVGCPAPTPGGRFGLGELMPALFDGRPAVVALRPPANGQRRADVLTCGTAKELATTSIPAH